jgi:hypothetical protein
MPSLSRRRFLAQSTAAIGLPLMIPRHVLAGLGKPGANEQVAIGIIGVGGRANLLLDQLPESGRLVALSDCNLLPHHPATPSQARLGPGEGRFCRRRGGQPETRASAAQGV